MKVVGKVEIDGVKRTVTQSVDGPTLICSLA